MIPAHASRSQTLSLSFPFPGLCGASAAEIISSLCYVFVTLKVNRCGVGTARVSESSRLKAHPIVKGLQQPRGWGLSKAFCLFWRLGEFSASTAVMFAFNIPVWRFLMSLPD